MTRLRSFGFTAPDPAAAAQQVAIIAALYARRDDLVTELVGDEGTVLYIDTQSDGWPPAWCLIRSGTDRYFIVMAGTTVDGPSHWIYNAWGTLARPLWIDKDGGIQWAWRSVWDNIIRPKVEEVIPIADMDLLYISGHSYGGGVAQIAGWDAAKTLDEDSVFVMSFAAPKAFQGGFDGQFPEHMFRIRSWEDIIPYLPPDRKYTLLTTFVAPYIFGVNVMKWQHYGADWWLSPDGVIGTGGYTPDPLPEFVTVGPVGEHYIRNYFGRLLAHYERQGGPPEMVQALSIAHTAITDPRGEPTIRDLPNIFWDRDRVPVPFPFVQLPLDPEPVGGRTVPIIYPTPVSDEDVFSVNLIFGSAETGWSENYFLRCASGADKFLVAKAWASKYLVERRKGMSSSAKCISARVGPVLTKGPTELLGDGDIGIGFGGVPGHASSAQLAWQVDLYDVTRWFKSRHPLRGFTDDWYRDTMKDGFKGKSFLPALTTYFDLLKPILTEDVSSLAGGTAHVVVRALNPDPNSWTKVKTTGFGMSGDGFLTATTAEELLSTTWDTGQVVFLNHRRVKGVKGINGEHVISKIVVSSGVSNVTFATKVLAVPQMMATFAGEMRKRPYAYYLATMMLQSRATSRDTGRPFAGFHGGQ